MLSEIYEYDIISNDTVNPPNNGIMESYYYLTGHLGSITDIVDENIEIVGIAQYSSFGSLLSSAGIFADQPYSYTAREQDIESDLYYYRSRYYNPSIGRFIQREFSAGITNTEDLFYKSNPFELLTKSTQIYNYAYNNPMLFIDNEGTQFFVSASWKEVNTGFTISAMMMTVSTINVINIFHKTVKKGIVGLFLQAEAHISKMCSSGGPNPNDPLKNKWKKEIKNFLKQIKKLAEKYLKGNQKQSVINKINELMEKAGIEQL